MTEITRLTLENEMDVVVAHKRMMLVAEFFGLSLSTQTTVSTAVAEIVRVVIDKTDTGILKIVVYRNDGKYFIAGRIDYDGTILLRENEEGLRNAKLLVPEFSMENNGPMSTVTVGIGIPRSFKLQQPRVLEAVSYFKSVQPGTPYEQLKLRNSALNLQALKTEEELQQTKLLDEKKKEFISIASHELKTPLTTIKAFTKLAIDASEQQVPDKVTRYLKKVENQVNKLHALVRQLLDISKIETGKLDLSCERVEWGEFMDELFPILEQLTPSHQLNSKPNLTEKIWVNIDRLRLEQVFTNLMNNAAKYSPHQSPIVLQYECSKEEITICIVDKGIGIPTANLERIFDKYFRDPQAAARYSGFGMGLYITATIVHDHGGKIWAESDGATGTTLFFSIPRLSN